MNDETKTFLKQVAIFILSSLIGGFIGGILANSCNHYKFERHTHMHKHFNHHMNDFEFKKPNFDNGIKPDENFFIEEDYIIIPKNILKNADNNPKEEKNNFRHLNKR